MLIRGFLSLGGRFLSYGARPVGHVSRFLGLNGSKFHQEPSMKNLSDILKCSIAVKC